MRTFFLRWCHFLKKIYTSIWNVQDHENAEISAGFAVSHQLTSLDTNNTKIIVEQVSQFFLVTEETIGAALLHLSLSLIFLFVSHILPK